MLRYIVGIKQYDSSNNYFIVLLCLHAHLFYCVLKNMCMATSLKHLTILHFKIKCSESIVIWSMYMFVRVDNVAVFVAWGWGPDTDSSEGHAGLSGIQQSKWISLLGEGSYNHMIKKKYTLLKIKKIRKIRKRTIIDIDQ